jgi:2-keto-3-deoxy-L-arabinonate dehydratase
VRLSGCLPVLATPYLEDESVDLKGIAGIVELNIAAGADALTCFGLASELYKLDDADRSQVLEAVMESVRGRVPVIVGCEHSGTLVAARRCRLAADAGAQAVMLLPPSFTVPQRASIRDYFLRCADSADIDIVVQDAPAWTGVQLPVDLLLEMYAEDERINTVKLEAPPISEKAQVLREAGMTVISGYGAVHFGEDAALGVVDGFMPGCAFPEVMVHAWSLAAAHDGTALRSLFARLMPLLIAELTDLDTFIEVQKRALVKRGVLSSAICREPHQSIPAARLEYLDQLIENILELGMGVQGNDDI